MKKFGILIEEFETVKLAQKFTRRYQKLETLLFDNYESANQYAARRFNSWTILECTQKAFSSNQTVLQATKLS